MRYIIPAILTVIGLVLGITKVAKPYVGDLSEELAKHQYQRTTEYYATEAETRLGRQPFAWLVSLIAWVYKLASGKK